jgi:hypothetical protein
MTPAAANGASTNTRSQLFETQGALYCINNWPAKLGMADAEQKKHFRHISDIDVWLTPDRNYFMFLILSVFGGLLALDHFYLRSFDTAFQKLLYNVFGLGIWYFWDLIQVLTEGQRVRNEGLNSPFDWIQGIGRGVFADSSILTGEEGGAGPGKSYILWAFLAIFGGIFALDKFYLGDTKHAVAKLISIFSPLVLFGVFWIAWDAFHAFFMTKTILSDTISLPFPLSYFGFKETDGSIFLKPAKETEGGGGFFDGFGGMFDFKLPSLSIGDSAIANAIKGIGPDQVKAAVRLVTTKPIIDAVDSLKTTIKEAADERRALAMSGATPASPLSGLFGSAAAATAPPIIATAATAGTPPPPPM